MLLQKVFRVLIVTLTDKKFWLKRELQSFALEIKPMYY